MGFSKQNGLEHAVLAARSMDRNISLAPHYYWEPLGNLMLLTTTLAEIKHRYLLRDAVFKVGFFFP